MRYTVEYYDDEDQRPCWAVVQWVWGSDGEYGTTVERCTTQTGAEAFARAYTLVNAFSE